MNSWVQRVVPFGVRTALVPVLACLALGAGGGGAATAATPAVDSADCGSTTSVTAGATVVNSFPALQSAIGSLEADQSATYQLDNDGTAGAFVAGSGQSLAIPDGANVTIDLDGCDLDISSPASSTAAIEVPASSSLTIADSSAAADGSLTAQGGNGSGDEGTAAGIGTNGGTDGADGTGTEDAPVVGNSGSITITGGTVSVSGGVDTSGNGGATGAGIGGGGGLTGTDPTAGGSSGPVTISGGNLTASSSVGIDGQTGAGIGGGGGGLTTTAGDSDAACGSGSTMVMSGGTVAAYGATIDPLADNGGIGIGAGQCTGNDSGPAPSSGTLTIEPGVAGAPVVGAAGGGSQVEVAAPVTIESGATLSVPAGYELDFDNAANVNNGTIALAGTLGGHGDLNNAGTIKPVGSDLNLPPFYETGVTPQGGNLGVSGNTYLLYFVNGGDYFDGIAPVWVLAPTTGDAGVTVPSDPANPPLLSTGWTVYAGADAGQAFTDNTPIAPGVDEGGARDVNNHSIEIPDMVPLVEAYAANNPKISAKLTSAHPETKYGWYGGPVKITFTCTDPPVGGITGSCPSAITVSKNGKKLGPWTGKITAAENAATASVTVRSFGLDTGHAKVKITGPANGRTYKSKAPAARCNATESLSGVAACKLTTHKTKLAHGFKETVTATATTRAGLTSSAKLAFKVTTAAKPKHKKH